jgi:transitional endoplasmic reticulum ATPase
VYTEFGPPAQVARVRALSEDRLRVYLEFRSGLSGTGDSDVPYELTVGSVVLVRPDEGELEPAPDAVWPEEPWIGVVRLRLADITAVDVGGRLLRIATNAVEYRVGNTVEGRDSQGVVRVLSEKPIRVLDLPGLDDDVVASFRHEPGASKLSFDDFGGLPDIVKRAQELIELPLEKHEALAKIGARPIKGVLLTGPPGTGKTLLARIIASRAGATFYEISGPEVFSKWYGESEELLRRIFEDAAGQPRSIIFFDEIDSVAAQRDSEGHEVSRRVVAQLLTLMDGFTADQNVVVVATTNRPQDIDRALRRPGRFDWEIDFPSPGIDDREAILRVVARPLALHGELPYHQLAERTETWTAAELAAIFSEAALLAVADNREVLVAEDVLGGHARVAGGRARTGGAGGDAA